MKVLFVTPSELYGGGESYLLNLIMSLNQDKSIDIYVLSANEYLIEKLNNIGIKVNKILPSRSLSFNTFLNIYSINKVIKKENPDIVFLNGLAEIGVYSRFIKSKKIITIGHSNEFWMRESWYEMSIKRLIKSVFIYNFQNHISRLIAINNEVMNSSKSKNGLYNKSCLIHTGINRIKINKLDDVSETIIFGRISRLCKGKGNELLLQAFSEVVKKHSNIKLILAGDGPDKINLINLSRKLNIYDKTIFLGHIEPVDFYSKIHCMISPSEMEAFPIVILEAMSCQIPVIATSVGGVVEMIDNNRTGKLIEVNDQQNLEDCMNDFILNIDEYKIMADSALIKFNNEFEMSNYTKNIKLLFAEVMHEN
ncbi:TPA: glycosyltransferase [Photobacterium damselae]